MEMHQHPTVKRLLAAQAERVVDDGSGVLDASRLKQLALECGADDAGVVEIGRPDLDPQRTEILRNYPWVKTLLSFVVRMTREPIRSPARSVANLEFHHAGEHCDDVAHKIVAHLEALGIRAVNPAMGFPMEMGQFPGYGVWVVSHKPVAVAAGLGHMGIHRNLIHPKFGNFVLLGTILMDAEVADRDMPLDYNPCMECKLCVAACPVGAIAPDGGFNFAACFTHNYREFMGGFTDWVEQIADSRDAFDYRRRVSEPETASMWQSLTYGANYKAAYCMAVCPAGEDVIGPYLRDRKRHIQEVLKPLQDKPETIYVIKGSDAEAVARKRWKHKTIKPVGNALRARSIDGMLQFMPHIFQPNQSHGLDATYHFAFTGVEVRQATIVIKNRAIQISEGHIGKANLKVTADSRAWLGFLAKERSLVSLLFRRQLRMKGSLRLLVAFGKCFPSPGVQHERVEVRPQKSLLVNKVAPHRRNDPATGKIKWSGHLVVTDIAAAADDVKTFRLAMPNGAPIPFAFLPGQFLTLHDGPDGAPARRSYTIASTPTRSDTIEITVKREPTGLVSRWLHDVIKPGDTLKVLAPNGSFVFTGEEAPAVVLIGGGVGITPLMSVARYLGDRRWPGAVHMILGFRKPSGYLFRAEIAALASQLPKLTVTAVMSNPQDEPWTGPTGHIDHAFLAAHGAIQATSRYHLCGPPAMMDGVRQALRQLGVAPEQIRMEAFGTIKRDPLSKTHGNGALKGRVTFGMAQVTVPLRNGATILDAAEDAGIAIDNACRSGTCGMCRVKLLSGQVDMISDDALTEEDKTAGYILACQAEARGDITVEA